MSWLFQDEDPKKTPAKPVAVPAPIPAAPLGSSASQWPPPSLGDVYGALRTRTDFAGTEVGAALAKYSEPLAGVIPDEKMRAKTAAKLAQAEGISVEKILATFDGLKVALQAEVSKFNSAGGQEESNIAAKEAQIKELSAQMSQIQTQVTQLGGEISDARSHVNKIKTEFNSAVNRRSLELDQEKAHYAEMLR